MEDIYESIVETFNEGMHIPLIRDGKYYTFIGTEVTTVNGVDHVDAIHYRISATNTKRITHQFIELTYKFYQDNNNEFPNVDWYINHELLKYEYKSRPCNKSVARGLISKVLNL